MIPPELQAHLESGSTTIARCWLITRRDGVALGFTDHDRPLAFDGHDFVADSGMSARAIEKSTGMSVDNSEAFGVLSHASVTEKDILAGRYDGAMVKLWIANWQDVRQRAMIFAGHLGEIEFGGGAFRAELRGLADRLNQPTGRRYQKTCAAVLGDSDCRFDLDTPGYHVTAAVQHSEDNRRFEIPGMPTFAEGWFARGRAVVASGAAAGQIGIVKSDRLVNGVRTIELWQAFGAPVVAGDEVRFESGCDKTYRTCRAKFSNGINFRGFPSIPGEEWLVAVPRSSGLNDGGSLAE